MQSNIVPFQFLENTIRTDGLVNLTALSGSYRLTTGKRKDRATWLATKEAKDSIAYLSRVTGITVTDLVISEHGIGTWVHPDLAEIFAQWLSVEYRFAVVALIRDKKQQTQSIHQPQKDRLLPSKELIASREIREMTDNLDDNPRLAQILIDSLINRVVDKAIAPSQAQLRGVIEVANELGFKTDASNRVKLGTFVAAKGFEIAREKRLCNGAMREINCYHDTPELRTAISEFFG